MAGRIKLSLRYPAFNETASPPCKQLNSSFWFRFNYSSNFWLSWNSLSNKKGAKRPSFICTLLRSFSSWGQIEYLRASSQSRSDSCWLIYWSTNTRLTELKLCPQLLKQARANILAVFASWSGERSFMTYAESDEVSINSFSLNTSLQRDM